MLFGEFEPEINCYLVTFISHHLCDDGHWCNQNQRRWVVADSVEHAREIVDRELKNPKFWPLEFHKYDYPVVYHLKNPEDRIKFNHGWIDNTFNPA